jgi:hypothetical protein
MNSRYQVCKLTAKSIINTRALYNCPNMALIAAVELVIGTGTRALQNKELRQYNLVT